MKFIAHRRTTPDADASILTDGQHTCTYRALPDLLSRLRDGFRERGIGPDACLALECENSLPSALILLYLLEEGYGFLLVPKPTQACQATPAVLPSFCQYRVTTKQGHVTELDPSHWVHVMPNDAYRESGSRGAPEPTVYLRTSGSTGPPKLAAHTHRGLRGNALNCIDRLHLESSDRIAIPAPLSHMFGLGAAFLPAVAVGASIDLQKNANLITYLTRERAFNPNLAFMTPSFCDSLLNGRKSARAYKLTVTAGDRMRGETFGRYEAQHGPLVQLYGSTEMGAIAVTSPDDPSDVRAQTVGMPLPRVEVRLEEKALGQERARPGEPSVMDDIGELWCRHAYGFHGWVDESGTPVRVDQRAGGGWFRMRDLGRISADGRIQVLGRSDHSINRSGLLVLFADIEKTMMRIPGVETVVIVADGQSEYGTGMAAFCVPTDGAHIEITDIRAACLRLLPRRAVPDALVVVDAFPLLPSGKVDRQVLTRMASVTPHTQHLAPAP